MTINKRKKNSRQRGSKTHGWGSMKKHRGAGSRGGRGRAGTGKRADTKKTQLWGSKKKYFSGPIMKPKSKKDRTINTQTIEIKLNKWLKNEKIQKKNNNYIIDLDKLGYDKLLSKGIIKSKLEISVKKCSNKVKEKVEKAGGKIILTKAPEKEKNTEKEEKQDKNQTERNQKNKTQNK